MTLYGDDADEMFQRHPLDEATIDRILSGRRVAGEDDLVSFVEDVHIAFSAGTPVPTSALMTMFAEGLSIEKGDLPATAASNVTGPDPQAAGLPKRKKKNMLEIALAKLASAALVAKLGVAAGAMTLAGTAAAATGSLPDPAQDFASDAAARAGITIPASEGRQDAEHRQDTNRRHDAENRKDADEVTADADGSEAPENFGTTVADTAKSGAPQDDGQKFGETTASSAPKAPQATEVPTADNNAGTDARSEAPTQQPEPTPTAEEHPGSDASGEAQGDTPTGDENPGTGRRP